MNFAAIPLSRALLSLAILLLASCGVDQPALELTEFVDFQRDQVTTRLISAPERVNLDRVSFGLRLESGKDSRNATLLMKGRNARITFFSAAGEVTGIEFEGKIRAGANPGSARLFARLNSARAGRLRLDPELERYRLEFPAGATRSGLNFLDLSRRGHLGPGGHGRLRIKRLRFLGAESRGQRLAAEARVTAVDNRIEMPASSFLDAVFLGTQSARFEARVEAVGRDAVGPAVVEVKLQDQDGVEHALSQHELAPGDSERIRAELARWAGEYVRLRLVVSGSAGARINWHGAKVRGVEGRGPDPLASIRIAPEAPPTSARLDQGERKPDVVLVLLDAARFDAFSCYGGPIATPVIDSLAADGTRFARALAPSSWTGQSVASVITGLYPDVLGVEQWGNALPTETPTIAELLGDAGYRTLLWSQHPLYRRWPSLVRGFDRLEVPGIADLAVFPDAEDLFLDDQPIFALIHLLPPHAPYEPPAPFLGSLTGWYRGEVKPEASFLHKFPQKIDPAVLDADDRRYIWQRYLENVVFADSLVGRIVEILREKGRYDQALIGLLSDHGEAFLEHGRFLHTSLLHQEFIQIPMVIKWPAELGGAAPVIAEAASSIDIMPTLVDGLALEAGGRGFQGRSVLPMVFDSAVPERCHFAITSGASRRLPKPRMMIECGEWKLHYNPITEVTQLYQIDTDPREQIDRATEHPTLALYLRQELLRQTFVNRSLTGRDAARDAEQALDAETIEQLKALGYLGGN